MTESAAPPWFVDAFDAMVTELNAHPAIQITHQSPKRRFPKTGKGTFASWLATKKKEPKALREVLAALGGFTLRWELHPQPIAKKRKPAPSLTQLDLEQPGATGCIAIVTSVVAPTAPEIVTFDHITDEMTISIGGRAYPAASFRRTLRFFDRGQYDTVEWVTPPGGPDGLVLGLDAHADYATRIVGVDEYMRILLATRGISSLRTAMFTGRLPVPETPPPLEAVLSGLASS